MLTVPRLRALQAEWKRNPPMPLLLAAWMGIRPREYGTSDELVERLRGLERT